MEEYDVNRIRVLYIDDDMDLISIYTRFFENSDYDLATALNAEQGFKLACDLIPQLIICDVILPGMSGVDLCRKIRGDGIFRNTIFMLVTGMDAESSDIVEGLRAGADEYLLKPFSKDELFARIHALLRLKRSKTETVLMDGERSDDRLRQELDEARSYLAKEKEGLNGALRQVAMMAEERENSVREIQRLETCLNQDRKALVTLLAGLIESRPQYHRGHSTAVADITAALSRMMDLPDDQIEDIHCASRLHELGKLSIPEGLAMKQPPEYSQAERDLLALHPLNGAKMLREFSGLGRVARIIRHIHEQVNGKGFPDGLIKDDIPLGSRIIAAVNLFDNLVNRGGAMGPGEALTMMDSLTGVMFDAGVMGCLRRYVNRHVKEEKKKALELRLFEVKPGMTLAADLYTAKGAKLLPENTVLTEDNINQLARYNKIDLLDETVFVKG